jgi:hypothetical protein
MQCSFIFFGFKISWSLVEGIYRELRGPPLFEKFDQKIISERLGHLILSPRKVEPQKNDKVWTPGWIFTKLFTQIQKKISITLGLYILSF